MFPASFLMFSYLRISGLLFVFGITVAMVLSGCSKPAPPVASAPADGASPTAAAHDHSRWWCSEHGVPEEVCTRCNSTLIAGIRDSKDWCDEHSRPDSQCFHCHPELQEKFAARYEAKYGEKPPKITDF